MNSTMVSSVSGSSQETHSSERRAFPKIDYVEQSMREGMQIEDVNIPVFDKISLLNALGRTGLRTISVGSFVSQRYTPQMARIADIVSGLKPVPGVRYVALVASGRYAEQAKKFSPPLSLDEGFASTTCHLCDVFVRRNWNRSQADEISRWEPTIARAALAGVNLASIGLGACWGSNFTGAFSMVQRMSLLERQHDLWSAAGVRVTRVALADPMSWCHPWAVEEQLLAIKATWPGITEFKLHLHNARGMALPSAYAAVRSLDSSDTLVLDGCIGGIGGCPYCGNGRATGQMATEDFVHMLHGMGIDIGVDLDKLIACVWTLEDVLGRTTAGFVSKAGPRPSGSNLYDPDIPFIETFEQARHFRLGPDAYRGGRYPWRQPVGAQLERTDYE